jgi:hypothetical protein
MVALNDLWIPDQGGLVAEISEYVPRESFLIIVRQSESKRSGQSDIVGVSICRAWRWPESSKMFQMTVPTLVE